MNSSCPICNKAGLPDYTNTRTVCPQCNSDLKPFMLLHAISKPKRNNQVLFSLVGIAIVAYTLVILYFDSLSDKKQTVSHNSNTFHQLQDSAHNLQTEITKQSPTVSPKTISEKGIIIQYKVKYGDCSSKIAHFFYNDWKMYKKIEVDNNLQQPYILKLGQTLNIKLKQQ